MDKIIANEIRCKLCGDIIESKYTHDSKVCLCKSVGIDGRLDYLKRIGSLEDFEELLEILEDREIIKFISPK